MTAIIRLERRFLEGQIIKEPMWEGDGVSHAPWYLYLGEEILARIVMQSDSIQQNVSTSFLATVFSDVDTDDDLHQRFPTCSKAMRWAEAESLKR